MKKCCKGAWNITEMGGNTEPLFGRNAKKQDELPFVLYVFHGAYCPIKVRYFTFTSPTLLRPIGISVPSMSVTSPVDTR